MIKNSKQSEHRGQMDLDRLFAFCMPIPMTGCWIWVDRSLTEEGYGQVWHDGEKWLAHRLAYALLVVLSR